MIAIILYSHTVLDKTKYNFKAVFRHDFQSFLFYTSIYLTLMLGTDLFVFGVEPFVEAPYVGGSVDVDVGVGDFYV